jgi:hypothetical protein
VPGDLSNIPALRKALGDGTDQKKLVDGLRSFDLKVKNEKEAETLIWLMLQQLLGQNRYLEAGLLLWGSDKFNPAPQATRRVFDAIDRYPLNIIIGSGGQSKTYSGVIRYLLEWIRDPQHTEEKLISTSGGHAEANIVSTLFDRHQDAIIPLPGVTQAGFLGLDPKRKHSAITLVAIPKGEEGEGTLRGFHPLPRGYEHPEFGAMTRVLCWIDEATRVPIGVAKGVSNLKTSMHGKHAIQITMATNPDDVTSWCAQLAEPKGGWGRLDPDKDIEWISREGWHVVRLDASESENVKQRRLVFPGFQSFEGYESLRLEGGGNSVNYWIFGRGMFPMAGAADNLIPMAYLDNARADLVFDSDVIPIAGNDLAFEGDDVTLAAGRYGRAVGYRKANDTRMTPFKEPRWCVQLDQVFILSKQHTEKQYEQIRFYCEQLGVPPEWLTGDATGVGKGVYDLLVNKWNSKVRLIIWGSSATTVKILSESRDTPEEICRTIETEMHYALRQWCEFGYFWISPRIDTSRLFNDLSGRKVRIVGKGPTGKPMMALEPKREFKKRNGKSPDFGDAVVMMLHSARANGHEKASFHGTRVRQLEPAETLLEVDVLEQHHFAEDY